MDRNQFFHLSHGRLIGILIVISFPFLMFGNGIVSLTHPDEVFYTQTVKEMLQHNSWATPYLFGAPQFEKPILTYWLMMIAIKIGGITPFAARFWMSFFGMAGVIVTYWLSFMLFYNKRIAFLSGFILTTSFIYIALSRAVLTDMIFSIWVVLSVTCFYLSYSYRKKKDLGIVLSFAASGLAVLTKGLLGLVFPVGIICIFLAYKKDFRFLKTKATFFGFLIFLLISLPWHILMIQKYGQAFIHEYWQNVHVRRLFDAEHQKSNTWHFYLLTMFGGMFPWSFFLLPAIYEAGQKIRKAGADKDKMAFIVIAVVFVWAVMQLPASKLASYIFPVFPGLAILIAYYFHQGMNEGANRFVTRSLQVVGILMAVFCVGGSIAVVVASKKYSAIIVDIRSVYIFAVALIFCAFGIILALKHKNYLKLLFSIGAIAGIFLFSVFFGYHNAEPWVSCQQITDKFKGLDYSDTTVLCSKFYVRGIRFYTDRDVAVIDSGKGFFSPHPIPYLNSDEKVRAFLETQPFTFAVVKESNVKDLERIAKRFNYEINYYDEIGGKYILKLTKKSLKK